MRTDNGLAVGRKIELPETGIFTEDGFFFHHVGTVHLDSEQIARLQEFGTGYVIGGHFTPKEDDLIRKNWKEYAEEYDIPPDSVRLYCGSGDRKENSYKEERQRRHFTLETNFWPRMCRGLPQRSGNQVKRRMLRIFDSAIISGKADVQFGRRNPLKWEELMEVIQLYKIYEDMTVVAQKMQRPYIQCSNAYQRFIEHNGRIFRNQWKTLWNVVTRVTEPPEDAHKHFGKLLQKAICRQDKERVEQLSSRIDFAKVAITMTRKKQHCKTAWKELTETFIEEFANHKERLEDRKQAWAAAYKKVFQTLEPVSAEKYSIFLRLLASCVEEEADYSVMLKSKYCDGEKLAELMVQHGITGFHTGGTPVTEMCYLFDKARKMLGRCEKFVLSRLVFKYTLKERVLLVSKAFDNQIEEAGFDVPSMEGTDQRTAIVSEKVTRQGHAILKRNSFIEALVVFTKKLDENWIPPAKFKKYVNSEEVMDLFPEEDDNSALLKHGENRRLLKEYENNMFGENMDDDDDE